MTDSSAPQLQRLGAGGKPSTWLPPGRLVELLFYKISFMFRFRKHFFTSGIITYHILCKIGFPIIRTCLPLKWICRDLNQYDLTRRSLHFIFGRFYNFRFFSFFMIFGLKDSDVDVSFSSSILDLEMKFADFTSSDSWPRDVFCKIMFSQNECWNIFLKFNFWICFSNLAVMETWHRR